MTALPAPAASLPARLPSLTGGRVILFVMAFFTHAVGAAYFFKDPKIDGLATRLPDAIATLSLFFVLSGFVLTWQEPWNMTFGRFARKRALKIFPSHVVTWAVTIILLAVIGPLTLIGPTSLGPALANLFLVQSWIPNPSYVFSVYGINWSVSCDILCYLVLPLLIRPILRIPARQLWMWLVGLMALIAVIPAVINAVVGGAPWSYWAPLSFQQVDAAFFFPVTKLPEFLLGVVLARMVQTGAWPNLRARWAWLATIVVWLAMFILPGIYKSSGVMAIAVCLFVPIIAMRDIEGRSKWLNRKPMVVLGDATYAAYLVQFPVLGLAKTLIGARVTFDAWSGALLVAGLFLANLLIGLLLYRFVERPVLRRFSVPSGPRQAVPAPEPAISG
jgi:3-O-acyltransferase